MPTNFYILFLAALIPLFVGSIYYNPKVFGSAWMKTNNFTEESLQGGNMLVIFGLSYFFSLMITLVLQGMVIHQTQIFSLFVPEVIDKGSAIHTEFTNLMSKYGGRFRTFGHGAFHGVIVSLFFVLPIIGINALFERRGWKYILIHTGYWLITLILMGGLLCATLKYDF